MDILLSASENNKPILTPRKRVAKGKIFWGVFAALSLSSHHIRLHCTSQHSANVSADRSSGCVRGIAAFLCSTLCRSTCLFGYAQSLFCLSLALSGGGGGAIYQVLLNTGPY